MTAAGHEDVGWASERLLERGYLAVVVADADLVVLSRHGLLAEDIPQGAALCDAVPPLFGMDEQARALRRMPDRTLEFPNISVVRAGQQAPRLSYLLFWDSFREHYVLMIQRSLTANDVSVELQQQVRRRMLAEAQLVEQAKVIEAANVSLMRMNRDLADFARIVSHDLKSPMRALRYFADDLERSLADPTRGDDPGEHLARLKAQSQRMASMLTGLLEYTRLEKKHEAASRVDMLALVERIVGSLPCPMGISITIEGRWPEVVTLEQPLDLIVRNLVDNAIKHHDLPEGRVVVRSIPADTHVVIEVEDDGPGIPPRYHDAVFAPYARLAEEGSDSIGMGLALVKRAADSVGAGLVVSSNPEVVRGTKFRLVWPYGDLTKA